MMCLNSLQATAHNPGAIQWLVQDDASPDVNLLACIPPYVARVERNEQNLGFAGNCNAGARRAIGDIIAYCNQDINAVYELSVGWDTAILSAFDDECVGIVGARLLFPSGQVQSVGGLIDARGTPFHRCLGYQNLDYYEINEPREVTWTTGAFMAIRRDLFWQLNGFDLIYSPSYFEDVDLCLRVREAGFKVMYTPAASFVHKVGSTGGSPHFQRSALRFKERWVDTKRVKPDVYYTAVQYW